jgi:hypothetical protein
LIGSFDYPLQINKLSRPALNMKLTGIYSPLAYRRGAGIKLNTWQPKRNSARAPSLCLSDLNRLSPIWSFD